MGIVCSPCCEIKKQMDFCFLSACVSDIYFSGVHYPQRENGDFTSAFWYREKSPFGQQKSPIESGFSQETSFCLHIMVRPEGFEPPAFRIGICCDIQLRHGRMYLP